MMQLRTIGIIHTPFEDVVGMPIQPPGGAGVGGVVDVFSAYCDGLKDLDGFSHIVLLYYFHRSVGFDLQPIPFLDTVPRGLFATRAPRRPNPIGLSVVQLGRIEGNTLYIRGVDMVDGTPLLDIKPYVPDYDGHTDVRTGWVEQARRTVGQRISDEQFTEK